MGKYRDHREPRRRGFDDDQATSSDRSAEPSYFQRAPQTGNAQSVDAEVLWFNADKGFGFVKASDGTEAYLHIRTLEASGNGAVSEGMKVKVRIEEGQKGFQVAQVMEVSGEGVRKPSHDRPSRAAPRHDAPEEESGGTVKWYNPDKGFGFIGLDNGEKDVFVHASALTRSGIGALTEGQKVVVRYAQGQKGLEARSIEIA